MRSRSRWRNFGLLAMLLALLSEGAFYAAGRFLQTRGVFYRPVAGDFETWRRRHDPVLGWPAPDEIGRGEYDRIGSRHVPAFPDPDTPALVSLYGDSFTWSNTVEPGEAWGNVLARRLGARVNNFGVGGYGSDQAFLRYRGNERDTAPVVILAHLTENVARNVNRFRDLMGGSGRLGFKPRFILDEGGGLELLPLPELSAEEYLLCVEHPEQVLEHEAFLPGRDPGPRRLRFPFTWSVLSALGHIRIRARLRGDPWFLELYDREHPARGVEVTEGILAAFVGEARARGQRPLVLLIPTGHDLRYRSRWGVFGYEPLVDRLERRELPLLDAGPVLFERLEGENLEGFFTGGDPGGHFNARGYALLAEVVHEHLVEQGLVE